VRTYTGRGLPDPVRPPVVEVGAMVLLILALAAIVLDGL